MAEGYLDTGVFNHRYSSSRYPNIWHIHPGIIVESIYYSNWRSNERDTTVHWTFTLTLRKVDSGNFSGTRGYPILFSANGVTDTQTVVTSPRTYTFTVNIDTGWASNDNETIHLGLVCHGNANRDGCSQGCEDPDMSFSCAVPYYQSEVPATNVQRGKVYSTNNTNPADGAHITDYLHNQMWFDWWGQSGGIPDSKWGIDYYNVDCATVNNVNIAGSKDGLTIRYRQNTRLSILDMAKAYGLKPGQTLYCWVNTCTKGAGWLGRVYLGSITMNKRGNILYKDSSGNKIECTSSYCNSTDRKTGRYALVKDDSGTQRVIDIYSSLY